MKNKKQIFIYGVMIIAGIIIGWMIFGGEKESSQPQSAESKGEQKNTIWTCSMHPQIRQDKPGKCPICGMELIPLNSGNDETTELNKIQMSESAMKIADVQTTVVQKATAGKEIRLQGKIKADERKMAVITSRFSGRIEKLFVNYTGQEVQKGEKMATVYSPELLTAQKELFEAIKLKQSNPEYYKAARNKLKLWSLSENQIDEIEKKGEVQYYFDVISPLSGTVMKRGVALGDHIEEGTMQFEIADLSGVWILFDAYERDLPWIKVGDNVSFEVQSVPGKTFSGKVTFIDAVIDPETRVAYIRTEANNSGKLLKPEMFVRGIFKTKLPAYETGLIIPKSSVLWTGKKAVVYVKDIHETKPTFEYREIILGEDAGDFYIVREGLTEGEEIVTNGVFKIDAAAQLAGKQSMMNSEGGGTSGHQHEGMNMPDEREKEGSDMSKVKGGINKISFKVFGNCEMCKERIEKAAKSVKGVTSANWNVETKIIDLYMSGESTTPGEVSKVISQAGHDTEFDNAEVDTYSKLPSCCQYERKNL